MINLKLILLHASHALDRRAVQYFTESFTVCSQLYAFFKLSPLIFYWGDKIKKASL